MRFVKKLAVVMAVTTAFTGLVGQGGVFAEGPDTLSDVATAMGTGTITPGLPTSGCAPQTDITFFGTGAFVGDDGIAVPGTVTFDGNSGSFCESLNAGQGTGTIGGTFFSPVNGVSYVRNGPIVQVFGSGTLNGGDTDSLGASVSAFGVRVNLGAVCIFLPTSMNPVTSYALACAAALQ